MDSVTGQTPEPMFPVETRLILVTLAERGDNIGGPGLVYHTTAPPMRTETSTRGRHL